MFQEMMPLNIVRTSDIHNGSTSCSGQASSTFDIDTGFTTLTKFVVWGVGVAGTNTCVIIYEPITIGSEKFSTSTIMTSAVAQRPRAAIGAAPTAYNASIMSITNGVVSIKNPTSANNCFYNNIRWYAEGE